MVLVWLVCVVRSVQGVGVGLWARARAHGEELREGTLCGCSVKLTRRQGYVNRRFGGSGVVCRCCTFGAEARARAG